MKVLTINIKYMTALHEMQGVVIEKKCSANR